MSDPTGDPTPLSRTPPYIKSALTGAILGLGGIVYGTLRRAFTGQDFLAWRTLGALVAVAMATGAVIGFLYHATRRIRTRGRLYEYGSWIISCTIGVFVVLVPELPQNGFWFTALFALWLGGSVGIVFGVLSRQLRGHRW